MDAREPLDTGLGDKDDSLLKDPAWLFSGRKACDVFSLL